MPDDRRDMREAGTLDLAACLATAVAAAEAAAPGILALYRAPDLAVERKGDDSPVTAADREAEQIIRQHLSAADGLVEADIVGEEFGASGHERDYCWLIDPIDGTSSFVRGLPSFGTLIALWDCAAERALAGVIQLPALGETYAAARGLGARCNGEPIRASQHAGLKSAVLGLADPGQFRETGFSVAFQALAISARELRIYGDCSSHAMAARGALDAVMEPWLNPWDIAATQVLMEEAGGACLIQPSRAPKTTSGTAFDAIFGSPALVEEIADMVGY